MNGLITELSPSCDAGTPVRRSVRRRLVQSTLFPHKPPEPRDKPNERDDEVDEQDEDYRDAANHMKRKSKGKATPRKKGSNFQNVTPKQNAPANGIKGSASLQVLVDFDQDTTVPNLRLEAKLSAEENSRMFAGKQIHPFFSSWKVGKKVQEQGESGGNSCPAKSGDERITCGPIHVFENIQDDTSYLDWRNWTFLENTTYINDDPESSKPSVLEGSVESLNFDKLLSATALDPSAASISQNAFSSSDRFLIHPKNLQEISPSSSTSPAEQTICPQTSKEVDLEIDGSDTFSVQPDIFRKSDTEPLSRFLQESMRPYYHSCKDKPEDSLWIYKYKPTKAAEVCGNDESVIFLRDWLHLWHERRYQSRKDTSNREKSHESDMHEDNDDDYYCSPSDYDSEDIDEDSLQNVLLVTGPTGSGKSAAVYACAQEQGFDILELNASDCRNGTVVKQYFGDTLGSLGFKRLSENTASSQKKTKKLPSALALLNGKADDKVKDGVVELISISDDEASPCETSRKLRDKSNVVACDKVQTLILVEDVDILFPEDRGCVAAIQQIAETARGPIILTSNSDNPGLPDNFDRLHVSFSLPSPKELLCHLYTVCLTEGVNIHPRLLEKFIQSCDGDMRKTIMHLQFWLQSKRFTKDGKLQTGYGSLSFDLEVGHQILPKMMPWDFPSEVSELIENEVAKSANQMEEKSCLLGLVREELHIDERQNDVVVQYMETDYIEAKKVEMIKRNGSIADYSELEIQYNAIPEFSNSSGSPLASSRQNRRKLVVMSSDSEDEDSYPIDTRDKANNIQSIKENDEFHLSENYPSTSVRKLVCSELEDSEDEHFIYSETAEDTCLNETCQSFDISCVPESTFVPETAIENGTETMSGAVSSGDVGPLEVSENDVSKPFTLNIRRRLAKLSQNSDLFVDTGISNSSQKEVIQDFLHENIQTTIANVMDECSRVDFRRKSTFVESSLSTETDMVQVLWRDLRERRMDLRKYTTAEQLGAFQVVKLATGLSNLISEADLFHNHQHKRDIVEPTMFLSGEAPSGSWYHEQTMMSTFAVHGFCFYAKLVADEGSKLDCGNRVDLTSEMLASSTNIMALGKLSRQGLTKSTVVYNGKELESSTPISDMQKSENKTSLFEVIQSIVPARVSLALKGDIFNEYLSTLRQISRSEAFRSSHDAEKKRRGRTRGAQHYLSRCTTLSPEDISLVSQGDLHRKCFSQHTTNVEGKL